eukprot:symbB.v1.2.025725.t1/scaffold2509.1/size77380/12
MSEHSACCNVHSDEALPKSRSLFVGLLLFYSILACVVTFSWAGWPR